MTSLPNIYLQNRIRVFSTILKIVIPLVALYGIAYLLIGLPVVAAFNLGLASMLILAWFLIRNGRYLTGLTISLLVATIVVTFESIAFGPDSGFIFIFFIIMVSAFLLVPKGENLLLVITSLLPIAGIYLSLYSFETIDPYYILDDSLMMALRQATIFLTVATILIALIIHRKWNLSYESELAQQHHFINSMYGSFRSTHLLIGADDKVLYVNQAGMENVEQFWKAKPAIDSTLEQISFPDFLDDLKCKLAEARADSKMVSWTTETFLNGRTRLLSIDISPVADKSGKTYATALVINDLTDRYELEKARKASERRYRELVESLQEIVLETSNTGRVTYLNHAWEKHTGFQISESLGSHFNAFLRGSSLQKWEQVVHALNANEPVGSFELEFLAASGEICSYEVHATHYHDQLSGVLFIRAALYNITRRKQDEKLLSEAGSMARIGAWEWNIKTNEVYWSDHTLKIFGLPPGHNYLTLEESLSFYKDVRTDDNASLEQIKANGNRTDNVHRVVLKNGTERWVKVVGILEWANDQAIRMSGMVQDITEEKQSREELEASRALLDSINQNIGDGVYRSSETEGLLYANNALLRMFGYNTLEEMKQVPSSNLYVDSKYKETMLAGASKSGDTFRDEVEYIRKDGSTFWGSFNATLTIEPDGTKIFDGSIRDITELRKARIEMREAKDAAEKATQVKAEFLSTMSHEIRTPMNAVIGMTELLLLEDPRDDQIDHLQVLKFSAENLLNIINDILDYSKIEAGRIELDEMEIDLRELLRNLVQGFQPKATEHNNKLSKQWGEGVPEKVFADRTRISQVLSNLIGNAVKFTKEGSVNVCTRLLAEDDETATIHFCVCDSGIGIPADKLEMIFERFTQASPSINHLYGGTGLGLSITKKLVELMGGEIQVSSEPDKGSEFTFALHLQKAPAQEHKTGRSNGQRGGEDVFTTFSGFRALLVEDNLMNVKLALRFLEKWGVVVAVANNGQEALEQLSINRFDIVLMDLQMPVMDGYTAAAHIREIDPDIPIIALTASVLLDVQTRIKASGMNDSVLKPINPKEFNQKLQRYLRPGNVVA